MNYFVNAISWRKLPKFPIEMTDFSDFSDCFTRLEEQLQANPEGYLTIRVHLEAEHIDDDEEIVIQYWYADTGRIQIIIADQSETCLHEGYELFLKPDNKISGVPVDPEVPGDPDPIVKIILDYGMYASTGIQWAMFLLHERNQGTLSKYFDDLFTQEIH